MKSYDLSSLPVTADTKRKLTSVFQLRSCAVFMTIVYFKSLHSSIIGNTRIGNLSENTVSSIRKNIEKARSHLNNHVTENGNVMSLDRKCEYCRIYLQD